MDDPIICTVHQDVAVLRVNRPEARNALNWAAQEQFSAAINQAAETAGLRVLVVTGTGRRAFVSGGDLKELAGYPEPEAGARLHRTMSQALAEMMALPCPVIAAMNGDAFGGGCEILTACDLRLAAAHARLGFAQVRNALTTGWGGTGRLVRLVGQSRAMELLLTGRVLAAAEAQAIGLVHRVVPEGEDVLPAAMAWAEEFKKLPAGALAATKSLVQSAGQSSLPEITSLERRLFAGLWSAPDHQEALQAFLDKREPIFNQSL